MTARNVGKDEINWIIHTLLMVLSLWETVINEAELSLRPIRFTLRRPSQRTEKYVHTKTVIINAYNLTCDSQKLSTQP